MSQQCGCFCVFLPKWGIQIHFFPNYLKLPKWWWFCPLVAPQVTGSDLNARTLHFCVISVSSGQSNQRRCGGQRIGGPGTRSSSPHCPQSTLQTPPTTPPSSHKKRNRGGWSSADTSLCFHLLFFYSVQEMKATICCRFCDTFCYVSLLKLSRPDLSQKVLTKVNNLEI